MASPSGCTSHKHITVLHPDRLGLALHIPNAWTFFLPPCITSFSLAYPRIRTASLFARLSAYTLTVSILIKGTIFILMGVMKYEMFVHTAGSPEAEISRNTRRAASC